ncbi:undecaprenyl-diphosphate phosphatase [Atopobacter phocae]|uniref:undecaprenyl-diphosphate phosphatase n=1 Tax=Atopobacter phocae TaxID=136492 RepID=UPI0004728676|nr:undecaprenyl-diphosphate phosphatase [Atopobacter phocae]
MQLIEWLKIILIGLIEGITEWLPVSSTGHMILFNELVKLPMTPDFEEMFLVVIQLGAILAVMLVFYQKLNPFNSTKSAIEKKQTWQMWGKIIIGCLPAAVLGLLLDDWMDRYLFNYVVVAIMLIVYGIFFLIIEQKHQITNERIQALEDLDYKTAFLIGCFQSLALIPGTSRSGATILGGLLLGTSRFVATEFSFFLSVPVMFGASLLKVRKFGFHFTGTELGMLGVGSLVAFIVSLIAVNFLLTYIKRNDFKAFAWYRIVLGIIVLVSFQFL